MIFADRVDAGIQLAAALQHYKDAGDILVLGLPRGGVPVAYEVAKSLDADMDVFVVRKIGAPNNEEFAMGAVAQGGGVYLDEAVIKMLHVPDDIVNKMIKIKSDEVKERIHRFRGEKKPPGLLGRTVILVDDGLATGSTMKATIKVLNSQNIGKLIVAVPVAPVSTLMEIKRMVDDVVCLYQDEGFMAVGQYYKDFSQVGDDEVASILSSFWSEKV